MPSYRITTEKTWDETLQDFEETFRKWRVRDWRVEPMRPPRKANQYHSEAERVVTLRYTRESRKVVLVSRSQARAHDNLRALYLATERMRLIDAAGLTDLVRTAYAQLPPPRGTLAQPPSPSDPYAVLGVERSDALDLIEAIYRARAKAAALGPQPSEEQLRQLNAAIAAIREEHGA